LPGVAVKVTEVPVHIGFADAVTDTLTGIDGVTIMVTVFDIPGFPVAQLKFEVRIHLTWSLFAGVQVKVELLRPAFIPFTFHW
jgi:hypothetical protein